jgi:hypothetical protein
MLREFVGESCVCRAACRDPRSVSGPLCLMWAIPQLRWRLHTNRLQCVLFLKDKGRENDKRGKEGKTIVTWPCVLRMRQETQVCLKTHAPTTTTGVCVCRFHGDAARRDAATRGNRGGNAKDGHWPDPDGLATGTTPRQSAAECSVWTEQQPYSVWPHFYTSVTFP